jgi:hypothetical protein
MEKKNRNSDKRNSIEQTSVKKGERYTVIMYFVIKQPTPAKPYNNSSRVKQHFQVLLVQDKLTSIFHWS